MNFQYKYRKYLSKLSGGNLQTVYDVLGNFFEYDTYLTQYLFVRHSRLNNQSEYPFFINNNIIADYYRSNYSNSQPLKKDEYRDEIPKNIKDSIDNYLEKCSGQIKLADNDLFHFVKANYNSPNKIIIENVWETQKKITIEKNIKYGEEIKVIIDEIIEELINKEQNTFVIIISRMIIKLKEKINIYTSKLYSNFEKKCVEIIKKLVFGDFFSELKEIGTTKYLFIYDLLFVLLSSLNLYEYMDYQKCETDYYNLSVSDTSIIKFTICQSASEALHVILICLVDTFKNPIKFEFYDSGKYIIEKPSPIYFEFNTDLCPSGATKNIPQEKISLYIGGLTSDSDINYIRNNKLFKVTDIYDINLFWNNESIELYKKKEKLKSSIISDIYKGLKVVFIIDTTLDIYIGQDKFMNTANYLYESLKSHINSGEIIFHIIKSHQKHSLCGSGKFSLGSIGTICNHISYSDYIKKIDSFTSYLSNKNFEAMQMLTHTLITESDKIYLNSILKVNRCVSLAYENSEFLIVNGPFIYINYYFLLKIYGMNTIETAIINDKIKEILVNYGIKKSETFMGIETTFVFHLFGEKWIRISVGCEFIQNPNFIDNLITNIFNTKKYHIENKSLVEKCLCKHSKNCLNLEELSSIKKKPGMISLKKYPKNFPKILITLDNFIYISEFIGYNIYYPKEHDLYKNIYNNALKNIINSQSVDIEMITQKTNNFKDAIIDFLSNHGV
jgi:hypothetical protein